MKLLLYCTKAKPELYNTDKGFVLTDFGIGEYYKDKVLLNGKIVAECDFTVFDIHPCASYKGELEYGSNCMWATFINEEDLLNKSCLTMEELNKYLASNKSSGYGIDIKNLHIFDKPKKITAYHCKLNKNDDQFMNGGCGYKFFFKAPQNMMKVYDHWGEGNDYILISIQPQWLCKILNGEKTIEVRKKVLKEMLK